MTSLAVEDGNNPFPRSPVRAHNTSQATEAERRNLRAQLGSGRRLISTTRQFASGLAGGEPGTAGVAALAGLAALRSVRLAG